MPRSEAIDMAVRRAARIETEPYNAPAEYALQSWDNAATLGLTEIIPVHAIRRHFAVICRQYGVRHTPDRSTLPGGIARL